jgi:VanZ family protein
MQGRHDLGKLPGDKHAPRFAEVQPSLAGVVKEYFALTGDQRVCPSVTIPGMPKTRSTLARWLPSVLIMSLIFVASATSGPDLPNWGPLDLLVKKGGHVVIYALLAVSYWYALGWKPDARRLAWLLAVLFAATDEAHQLFTPGRHAWWLDVVIFDALGALLGLWLAGKIRLRMGYSNSRSSSSSSPQSSRRSM